MEGDNIFLQIVPPLSEKVIDIFKGETVMKWKNLLLKRLEGMDIVIWQMTDLPGQLRRIDSSIFLPAVAAVVVFYDIKDLNTLKEWLQEIKTDDRTKSARIFIIGSYQNGEPTKDFKKLIQKEMPNIFLWKYNDYPAIIEIYEKIIELYENDC